MICVPALRRRLIRDAGPPHAQTSTANRETSKIALNATGHALLRAGYGHLNATLTILESSPSPSDTQTKIVHLTQQKAHDKTEK